MRKTHEKDIDGTLWTVNEFSATEGLRLLTRLTNLCGGPVAKALESLPKGEGILDAKIDFGLLGAALTDLTQRLDEDQVVELIKRLLACTIAKEPGEKSKEAGRHFDVTFQGRYLTLFKVLGFVLEVNFKVPLSGWLDAASVAALAADRAEARGQA